MRSRHQRFVEEYAKDWNATAAYRRAGYRARGHSARSTRRVVPVPRRSFSFVIPAYLAMIGLQTTALSALS
jgi:hypothetical protein